MACSRTVATHDAKNLHLAMIEVPASLAKASMQGVEVNSDSMTCLRSVLMKPEHADWIDPIVAILEECAC